MLLKKEIYLDLSTTAVIQMLRHKRYLDLERCIHRASVILCVYDWLCTLCSNRTEVKLCNGIITNIGVGIQEMGCFLAIVSERFLLNHAVELH